MRKAWLLMLPFAVVPVFGQLESNTLTISATRQINLQPDQVVFYLSVGSGVSASLDQILTALSALNITSTNLTGVYNSTPQILQWTFTLAVPFGNLAATIGSLTALQGAITQNNSGLALLFSVTGTRVSAQLQQSQSCSTSDLLADAKVQAQKVAIAAGLVVGPVLTLSEAPATQPSAVDFAGFLAATPPQTCSLVVQFQLQS